MWRTVLGERTLEGAEAKVFAEALWGLLDEPNLSQFDDYDTGVKAFDRLTYGQKISVLSIVGNGLLRVEVPCAELTAVLEAAIAAVFEHLRICIMVEIDKPELGTTWREKVITARLEMGGEDLPPVSCQDAEEWDIEVESLADSILWDADYDDEDTYVDVSPEKADLLRKMAGISSRYYFASADDLGEKELETKLVQLRKLCRSIVYRT